MRITNSMMVNRLMMNMNNNLKRMDKIQNDYNSGVKLHKPSDDPVLVARSLKLHTDIRENDQFAKNIDDAYSILDKTETSLNELHSVLHRVRELTDQAANGVLTNEDTIKINAEMKQLKEQIIKISNDTYVGRHIYSGYKTDQSYLKDNGSNNISLEKEMKSDILNAPITIPAAPNNKFELDVTGIARPDGTKYTGKYTVELTNEVYGGGSSKTIDDLATDIQNKLNGDSIELTKNTTWGDDQLSTGDIVSVRFEKEVDASSIQDVKDEIEAKFGAGNVTIETKDNKFFTITMNTNVDTTTPIEPTFSIGSISYKDGTTNSAEVKFTIEDNDPSKEPGQDYIPLEERDFSVTVENNQLIIKNPKIQDNQKFAIRSMNDGLDLKKIGLVKVNISESNEKLEYQIGISANLSINVRGDEVFGPVVDSDEDGIPDETIIDTMNELILHLENGNSIEISNKLKEIDVHMDNVSKIRASVGARTNTAETVKERIADTKVNLAKLLSQTEDTDMGEASIQLMTYEAIYKASLNIGARIVQPTLVDFIR